ncbi:MAG: V-type ATP synthase subunit D, partial [FCB group bacterium]|nr:V-type ATP synthase subunit D [FCB group bacterium]
IPELSAAIRTIRLKLDEMERGNLTRLMKVKEMVEQK